MRKNAALFMCCMLLAACSKDALPWHSRAGKEVLELVRAQGPTVSIEVAQPVVSNEQQQRAKVLVVALNNEGYVFGDIPQPACTISIVTAGYDVACVDGAKHAGISHAAGVLRAIQEFKEPTKK